MTRKQTNNEPFDTNKAWENLYARLKEDNLLETSKPKVTFQKPFYKVAALLLAVLSISFLAFYYLTTGLKHQVVTVENNLEKSIKKIQLPDGSIVWLNASAKIKYDETFNINTRLIEFEGEAFFEISKMKNKAFIIKTKQAQIKVLGTSFSVNTHVAEKNLEVLVATGKVEVAKTENKKMTLLPGEMVTVNTQNFEKNINSNKNYLSWKTKEFDFKNVEMQQVVKDLSKAYRVNIVIENSEIGQRKLHSSFSNKNLETILQVICETYNLQIHKINNQIILK